MANTMKALQTVTVGAGGAASVTFSSIPQTYTDLVIKISARSTDAGTVDVVKAQFISGSDANGSYRDIVGQGSTTGSTTGSSYIRFGRITAAGSTTSTFSTNEIYIPNYVGSNYKSYSVDLAREQNSSTDNDVTLMAGLWSNTLPITGIVLLPVLANFAQYSTFTLYGVFNQDVSVAPAAPTIGTATAGAASASITFTGVSGAASYTMTSSPGGFTGTGTSSPITVSGLTNGTAYTFTCTANNPIGTSAASAASNSVTPVAKPVVTGGTLTSDSTYYYRTFTSSGTLGISGASLTFDYSIQAGGGGSGTSYYVNCCGITVKLNGGAGGAGGNLRGTTTQSTNQTVTVGAGGSGGSGGSGGTNGSDSVLGSFTASGGGGTTGGVGNNGGSGGGAAAYRDSNGTYYSRAGGLPASGQGFAGGASYAINSFSSVAGGAGGGAGGVGASAGCGYSGTGGIGVDLWGRGTYYGGGGGGAGNGGSWAGGAGGGGASGNNVTGVAGTANTGGGAGATSKSTASTGFISGTSGGSGIVIVRYTKSQVD